MTASPAHPPLDSRPRVRAVVALRLFEVLKSQDRPLEILEDEDPTVTMPRRLGLSGVVDRQIRSFREDVRRRVRLSDAEIGDLFRLVTRRPDSEEIFLRLGAALAGDDEPSWLVRHLPERFEVAVARWRVARRLKQLFGRKIGGFGRGGFALEGRSLLFYRADPGGDACALVTGFCEAMAEQVTGLRFRLRHLRCQARGDAVCRWEAAWGEDAMAGRSSAVPPGGAAQRPPA